MDHFDSADALSAITGPPAKAFYQKLHTQLEDVQKSLQPGASVMLTHAAASGTCIVESIGFHGADMIVLTGVDQAGRWCRLLVHLHAVNLTMTIVRGEDARKYPIGFSGELGKEPSAESPETN